MSKAKFIETVIGDVVTRAGLSIVPVVPWEGAPTARAAKFLPQCVDV